MLNMVTFCNKVTYCMLTLVNALNIYNDFYSIYCDFVVVIFFLCEYELTIVYLEINIKAV